MQLDVLPVACDLFINNENENQEFIQERTQDVLKQHVMILRKCAYLGYLQADYCISHADDLFCILSTGQRESLFRPQHSLKHPG